MTVVQEWSSWPPPHPIRLFPLQSSIFSHPYPPQGSQGHTRVGGGVCPPHSSQVSCPKVGIACSNGLVSPGLGTPGAAGALHWRVSPHLWGPEAPEVTEPSRLVGESSGGEVRKQQLDTRVRQEPPGRPVSGAEWGGQGAEAGLKAQGRRAAARGWVPPRPLAPAASPFVQWATKWVLETTSGNTPTCPTPGPLHHRGVPLPSVDRHAQDSVQPWSAFCQPSLFSFQSKWFCSRWGLGRAIEAGRSS